MPCKHGTRPSRADDQELTEREPTETFLVQADIYFDDKDEDLLELKGVHKVFESDRDRDPADGPKAESGSEPGGLGNQAEPEVHLAAIYEEVADLRHQVRLVRSIDICGRHIG